MMNSKTVAFLFAMFSLGGMIAVPGLSTAAYAQIPDAQSIVDGVLDDVFGEDEAEAEEEEAAAADNTQTIEQPIDQDIDQEVDQSEENEQDNDNTQTQVGAIDQGIIQGIEDGDDSASAAAEAESESESGDAKKKDSSSSSSSGDAEADAEAENENQQGATNDARLQQLQVQNVDQDNFAEFGDDTANLDAVNVAIPIAIPVNLQEELEEVDEEPPVDEEDTITVCVDETDEREVTLAQLAELIEDEEDFTIGECPEVENNIG